MDKKEILIYDTNGVCIGLYPVEKVIYKQYPVIVYGDVVIFDNDPPVFVLFLADVEYGMVIPKDIANNFIGHINVVIQNELKAVINNKYGINAIDGVDLDSGPAASVKLAREYVSRFAKANNMSIEDAKKQAICKECFKSYEEEK